MRVVVVEPVGEGGMIHFAHQMCNAMASRGADVTLVTSTDYELADLPHECKVEASMRLWPRFDPALTEKPRGPLGRAWLNVWWSVRRVRRAVRLVTEWARVVRRLRAVQPDVVQVSAVQFPGARLILSRLRGIKLTQVCHEFELREARIGWVGRVGNWLLRRTHQVFDFTFLLGEEVRLRFVESTRVPIEQTHVIPHGNENLLMDGPPRPGLLRDRYGLRESDRVVLFFGNIRPSKGLPDLIEAFAQLGDIEDAKLVVAGFPAREVNMADVHAEVDNLGISDRVVFDTRYIPLDEVSSLLALSNVVAFPYRNATQSGVVQAAYAAGRPVVVTDVGSIPEVVEDGVTGFVVERGNSVALAEALRSILTNPEMGAAMGDNAKQASLTKFSWEAIAGDMLEVYAKLID